jgi:hypothetical protein
VIGARLPIGTLPEACFWDTSDPYYYLRVDRRDGDDYAIFGGCDHKTGQEPDTDEPFRKLFETLRTFAPQAVIADRWTGQVIETPDGLPYIGENTEGQFISTGYAGNGTTLGTVGAMMARDWVLGMSNPWRELFAPDRKKAAGVWDYVKENKDYPYYMVKDRLSEATDTRSPMWQMEKARSCGSMGRSSQCIGMTPATSARIQRSARIWGALLAGTRPKKAGTAHATAHGSIRAGRFSRGLQRVR